MSHTVIRQWLLVVAIFGIACPVFGAPPKRLEGHVPEPSRHLAALGKISTTNELRLAIGLPLRDPAGLKSFLADVYDPTSPNYRKFLTPDELADRFGPSEADYVAIKNFARSNGFTITGEHGNRLLLDVRGKAADMERAFHFNLQRFKHPTETREFFAPDADPSVDAALPVADIQGLSDFYRPHSKMHKLAASKIISKNGTAPNGSGNFFGDDFRKAYASGTTLTGAGQMVGLLQFDGYYTNDILSYARAAGGGRTNIVIQNVLLDGFNGTPTTGVNSGNSEVALDIEMSMAMAPGLAKIVVFEAGPNGLQNDILNSMLASNMVKNLSCSWGWGGGPSATTDNIFQFMAAAGQSFFNASGDTDAFIAGSNNDVDSTAQANAPSSCPYITQVGGTTLTMNGAGASFASETVWNDRTVNANGGNWGSSGGISTYYAIPSWQTNTSMAAAAGSTTKRNIPDVALTANQVYSTYDNGSSGSTGGTSCAAPLWAGFMALVNQQAASLGNSSVGFINPAVFAISHTANYANCFHDTTTGDNSWSSSGGKFFAVVGYDLATGLGTPNGVALINALAGSTDTLALSPFTGFSLTGPLKGPFNPSSGTFQLTNSSNASLNWSLVVTSSWVSAVFTNGMLAAHATTNLTVSLAAAANNLPVGIFSTILRFTNQTSHVAQTVPFGLQVTPPLSVSPVKGFTAVGPVGGSFAGGSQVFVLTNLSGSAANWSLIKTSAWLSVSLTNGTLAGGGSTNLTVSLTAAANSLAAAVYSANLVFSNASGAFAAVPFTLAIGQPLLQNGGFETGDFTGWTQSGNTAYTTVVTTSTYVHGGTHGAEFGASGSPGYISQNLLTIPGQTYLLSLWVRNAAGTTPNLFSAQWDGNTVASWSNFTTTAWTNFQCLVTASTSSTPLQLGLQDDPSYLAIDDVTVSAVTTPGFKSVLKSTNSFKLTFNTTSGLKYQTQYKTNLTQPTWFNLGNVVTATTNVVSVTDTNTATSAQRFYRLLVTP